MSPIRKGVRNLFLILAEEINDTTLALEFIEPRLNSLARFVIDDRLALEFLLWSTQVSTDQVQVSIQKLKDKAAWLANG